MTANHSNRETEGASLAARRGSQLGRLPMQNLVLGAFVIGAVGAAAQLLNLRTAFPFGWFAAPASGNLSWRLVPTLSIPLVGTVALLSARSVTQLWLWPRRKLPGHGYRVLLASAGLALLPQAAWDLLATHRLHWWTWAASAPSWEGIALWNLAGLFLVNLIALCCATPALINKHPRPRPPGLSTLGIWSGLTLALLAGSLGRASDAALAVLAAPVVILAVLAFRNVKSVSMDEPPSPEKLE